MQIIKKEFQTIIVGKCITPKDIIELFNFGFDKESISKKYKKDNKVGIKEARKFVENVLFQEVKRRSI